MPVIDLGLANTDTASKQHKVIPGIDGSKVLEICHAGDQICRGTSMLLLTHFTYIKDTPQAAKFVAKLLG